MGKTSVTEEQKDWLESHIPAFVEARKKSTVGRFHARIAESWFQKYPERNALFPMTNGEQLEVLTLPQEVQLRDAIKARKLQLKNWFNWNGRPYKRSSEGTDQNLLSNFFTHHSEKSKRTRHLNATEVYGKLYAEKVRDAVKAAKANESGKKLSQGDQLILFRTVRATLFNSETEAVKAEVAAECEKQRVGSPGSGQDRHVNLGDGEEDLEKTPADYQKAIDELPDVLDKFFDWLCASTGWAFFIGCAGPLPKAGGTVFQHEYYFGPKSDGGRDFHEAYSGYRKGFSQPFSLFMRNAFPPEVRKARALSFQGVGHPVPLDDDPISLDDDLPLLDDDLADTLIAMPRSGSLCPEMMSSFGPGIRENSMPSSPLSTSAPLDAPSVLKITDPTPAHFPQNQVVLPGALSNDDNLAVNNVGVDNDLDAIRSEGFGEILGRTSSAGSSEWLELDEPSTEIEESPYAPGAPSSPISHAFARMDQSVLHAHSSPASPPTPPEPFIDPLLYMENMGKPAPTAGISNACAPGFVFQTTPPRRQCFTSTTQETSELDNPFATLASNSLIFGRPPINPFTFGRKSPTNKPPTTTPFGTTSSPSVALAIPMPIPLSTTPKPLSTPPDIAPSPPNVGSANYVVAGAIVGTALASLGDATQTQPKSRPRPIKKSQPKRPHPIKKSQPKIRPRPIKKPQAAKTDGGDIDHSSSDANANHAPGSADAETPPTNVNQPFSATNADQTSSGTNPDHPSSGTNPDHPSSGTNTDHPSGSSDTVPTSSGAEQVTMDVQGGKENVPLEMTRYQKAALTKARKKAEAAAAQATTAQKLPPKSSKASMVAEAGGKKRKEPEGGQKSRSGREVKKPNYWVPDA